MKITINRATINKTNIKEIVINEATVQHLIDASRLVPAQDTQAFMAAVISQICLFDGKALTYEEITTLPAVVFLELSAALETSGILPSEGVSSTLSKMDTSATKA